MGEEPVAPEFLRYETLALPPTHAGAHSGLLVWKLPGALATRTFHITQGWARPSSTWASFGHSLGVILKVHNDKDTGC